MIMQNFRKAVSSQVNGSYQFMSALLGTPSTVLIRILSLKYLQQTHHNQFSGHHGEGQKDIEFSNDGLQNSSVKFMI